jgi:hypothetical protein
VVDVQENFYWRLLEIRYAISEIYIIRLILRIEWNIIRLGTSERRLIT